MFPEERLDILAGSVSDGLDIDWTAAERDAPDVAGKAGVHALREVARIAQFNRELQRSPLPGESTAPSGTQTLRWGDLTLLEPVGREVGGEVWRAWDPTLLREVALKFLRPQGSTPRDSGSVSLLNEARALARVRHPGVVAVHGIAENDGRMGMWMEYVHGATLAREIELRGALPPRDVARIGLELSRALESVHREGLVHADVKPANVVLEAGGRVVLVDFGLGKHFVLSDSETVRPSGTPLFMSPELLSGEPATPRSDLYALGVTMRWALTGQPPFRSSTLAELRAEAEAGPSRPLAEEQPAAPRRLVTTIERAMAPDPRTGFGGADRMVAALETALDEIDGGASPRRRSAAGPVIAGIAIAAILAAIALAPRFLRSSARTDRTNGAVPDAADRGIIGLVSQRAYQVDATFVRRSSGEFRHLSAGDRVSPGDQLSLEFCATSPLWVYVLNQDERGETYLLFPQPLFDVSNPIPADSTLVLPGLIGGVENSWTVTSRGGREHFLVVASRGPVADIERELGRLPAAKPGRPIQYAAVDTSTIGRLRAVGGVQPLPPGAAQHRSSAFDRFQALAGRETVTEDIWVRKITLENPLE